MVDDGDADCEVKGVGRVGEGEGVGDEDVGVVVGAVDVGRGGASSCLGL